MSLKNHLITLTTFALVLGVLFLMVIWPTLFAIFTIAFFFVSFYMIIYSVVRCMREPDEALDWPAWRPIPELPPKSKRN